MKTYVKALSVLLSVVLILPFMPSPAFAGDEGSDSNESIPVTSK